MGKVVTDIVIINLLDELKADEGIIQRSAIRKIELKGVLVDTGATTLCLTKSSIQKLGLRVLREANVSTASGFMPMKIYEGLKIMIEVRHEVYDWR